MIKLLNHFAGKIIILFVPLLLFSFPKLKNKLSIIKETIISNRPTVKYPNNLIKSVVLIEDKRFFVHRGVDLYAISRAIFKNITTKRIEGASTIGQQMVRNILNDSEKTFRRKFNEVILATIVDSQFNKNEILYTYLDTYKFGNKIGVNSLCEGENYNIYNLSEYDAAQIAARLKYPNITKWNYIRYLKRVRRIEINNA